LKEVPKRVCVSVKEYTPSSLKRQKKSHKVWRGKSDSQLLIVADLLQRIDRNRERKNTCAETLRRGGKTVRLHVKKTIRIQIPGTTGISQPGKR